MVDAPGPGGHPQATSRLVRASSSRQRSTRYRSARRRAFSIARAADSAANLTTWCCASPPGPSTASRRMYSSQSAGQRPNSLAKNPIRMPPIRLVGSVRLVGLPWSFPLVNSLQRPRISCGVRFRWAFGGKVGRQLVPGARRANGDLRVQPACPRRGGGQARRVQVSCGTDRRVVFLARSSVIHAPSAGVRHSSRDPGVALRWTNSHAGRAAIAYSCAPIHVGLDERGVRANVATRTKFAHCRQFIPVALLSRRHSPRPGDPLVCVLHWGRRRPAVRAPATDRSRAGAEMKVRLVGRSDLLFTPGSGQVIACSADKTGRCRLSRFPFTPVEG